MAKIFISRTPYRISLGGGGTDLPFYSNAYGGQLITAAIDQYITVSVSPRFLDDRILIQTTDVQFCNYLDEINNDLIRETLRYFKIKNGIQISTFTSLPTGIGLGSSSTVIVGLIKALIQMLNIEYTQTELAEVAYHIEREILGFPGGVQDQYIAAIGGIQMIHSNIGTDVKCMPLEVNKRNLTKLEDHLVLIYTGKERFSTNIIKSQEVADQSTIVGVYDEIKDIGKRSIEHLVNADIGNLGQLMDRHWEIKRKLSNKISNSKFDDLYLKFKKIGSPGGKIVGAGGGGFFMMAVPSNPSLFREKVHKMGYSTLRWKFEFNGSFLIGDQIGI